MPRDASESGTPPRARGRGGVPSLSLQRQARRGGTGWSATFTIRRAARMFVRLQESPKGPAGKWTDAATGEHGDLLDIIRESLGLRDFREVAEEARRFLKLPRPEPDTRAEARSSASAGRIARGRKTAVCDVAARSRGRVAETYLQRRGITHVHHGGSLRFHPRCYYRPDEHLPTETWPAMIACVTDLDGRITGVHRTWLDPDGFDRVRLGKAPIDTPRRAMGDLLGNAFASAWPMTCSPPARASRPCCRCAVCCRPCRWPQRSRPITSAAMLLPVGLRRLYIARDADAAGDAVQATSDAARRSRRHRSDRLVAPAGRLQRRSAHLRPRGPPSSVAAPARTGGRRPLPAFVDGSGGIARGASIDVDRSVTARPMPEEVATTAF